MKPTFPQIISLAALTCATILFVLGKSEEGAAVLACAAFQLIPSPLPSKPRDEP